MSAFIYLNLLLKYISSEIFRHTGLFKYFCVTPSLSERKPCLESQKLWRWSSVGLCDKFLPRVRCNAWMLLDKKGTRTAELVQPANEESTRWEESFPLFRPIFRHPTPPRNSASHIKRSMQCFGKLESCTGFHLLYALGSH